MHLLLNIIVSVLAYSDIWVMSKFRLPTILRPLFNIFEGLVVLQNYENSLYGVYSKVKEADYLTHAR